MARAGSGPADKVDQIRCRLQISVTQKFSQCSFVQGPQVPFDQEGCGAEPREENFEVEYEEKMHALHPHTLHN